MLTGLKYTAMLISHNKNTFLQTQQGMLRNPEMETGQKNCVDVFREKSITTQVKAGISDSLLK